VLKCYEHKRCLESWTVWTWNQKYRPFGIRSDFLWPGRLPRGFWKLVMSTGNTTAYYDDDIYSLNGGNNNLTITVSGTL